MLFLTLQLQFACLLPYSRAFHDFHSLQLHMIIINIYPYEKIGIIHVHSDAYIVPLLYPISMKTCPLLCFFGRPIQP